MLLIRVVSSFKGIYRILFCRKLSRSWNRVKQRQIGRHDCTRCGQDPGNTGWVYAVYCVDDLCSKQLQDCCNWCGFPSERTWFLEYWIEPLTELGVILISARFKIRYSESEYLRCNQNNAILCLKSSVGTQKFLVTCAKKNEKNSGNFR